MGGLASTLEPALAGVNVHLAPVPAAQRTATHAVTPTAYVREQPRTSAVVAVAVTGVAFGLRHPADLFT
jgi:hypothetical protein